MKRNIWTFSTFFTYIWCVRMEFLLHTTHTHTHIANIHIYIYCYEIHRHSIGYCSHTVCTFLCIFIIFRTAANVCVCVFISHPRYDLSSCGRFLISYDGFIERDENMDDAGVDAKNRMWICDIYMVYIYIFVSRILGLAGYAVWVEKRERESPSICDEGDERKSVSFLDRFLELPMLPAAADLVAAPNYSTKKNIFFRFLLSFLLTNWWKGKHLSVWFDVVFVRSIGQSSSGFMWDAWIAKICVCVGIFLESVMLLPFSHKHITFGSVHTWDRATLAQLDGQREHQRVAMSQWHNTVFDRQTKPCVRVCITGSLSHTFQEKKKNEKLFSVQSKLMAKNIEWSRRPLVVMD